MVEQNNQDDLKIEPQTLQLIENHISEYVDPKQLTSIATETRTTEMSDESLKCGTCNRIPVEPVLDDNCDQYFCRPCIGNLEKQNGPCPMPECPMQFKSGKTPKQVTAQY